MEKANKNKIREDRILNEIVVDAYDIEERISGWQTYLEDKLEFPFEAKCIQEMEISPLLRNEIVTVLKMANGKICNNSMFVIIKWQNRQLGVPLEQLLPVVSSDNEAAEAVKDWHYWIKRGYEF